MATRECFIYFQRATLDQHARTTVIGHNFVFKIHLRIKAWLKLWTENDGLIPAQTGLTLYLNPSFPSCLFRWNVLWAAQSHFLEVDTEVAKFLDLLWLLSLGSIRHQHNSPQLTGARTLCKTFNTSLVVTACFFKLYIGQSFLNKSADTLWWLVIAFFDIKHDITYKCKGSKQIFLKTLTAKVQFLSLSECLDLIRCHLSELIMVFAVLLFWQGIVKIRGRLRIKMLHSIYSNCQIYNLTWHWYVHLFE